ncbi:5,10-methylenetetrahydrofolate reductase-like [Drosophila innubila]|uniref:5,10-methylenetetrahydrofolate reductase-like n=1 Tax=Drosophila innubila TaxID=198719 RepID=UPI00148D1A3F|nr:5,10-methylenetetrahydrofolate reductase-like [Drosophila innubila]
MCLNLIQMRASRLLLRNISTLFRNNGIQYYSQNRRMCSSTTMENNPDPSLILETCFTFTDSQKELCLGDPNIADMVAKKTACKEFFYGIETKALSDGKPACLDFNMFLPNMPMWISVVWTKSFSEAIETTTMKYVPNIQMMPKLFEHIPAMPHLTLFRLTQKHMDDFLALKLNNVLVIRGDHVEDGQEYSYAYQAVEYLRKAAGKSLAISVAGYPEGHTSLATGPPNKAQDIEYLKLKMDAGADFIVTQLCYCGDTIVEFLRDARDAGITAPIVLGILIPENYARYLRMSSFSKVVLSPERLKELEEIKEDDAKVQDYFVQLSVCNIVQVIGADLGVSGIHFYTLNRFTPVLACINELRKLGILKDEDS